MDELYDAVVIGGGPAGLTAGLYLARARCRVAVLERAQTGGQIVLTQEVVNYPGVEKTSGSALADSMRRQAERFGAEIVQTEARRLERSDDLWTVETDRGSLRSFGVILATGAQPRQVGFIGEESHRGRGVAYCATCDGAFFTGRQVFVIGGGYAAAEESVFLTRYARKVTILMRKGDFSCAAAVAEQARNHEKITILPHTEVEEVRGENGLDYLRYRNNVTGEVTEYRAAPGDPFGLFVLAGYVPDTGLVRGLAELDDRGCLITDDRQRASLPGLFGAGDVCAKPLRQVVTAVSDGALAAVALEAHAAAMRQRTGLRPRPVDTRQPAQEAPAAADGPFSPNVLEALDQVLAKLERPLRLRLLTDQRPVSAQLEDYLEALAARSSRLTVERGDADPEEALPCVRIRREDGTDTGLAFHGVPGGHEFTSFVLALYNAAGPGQRLEEGLRRRIAALREPVSLQVLVTLSCTLCPELVTAAQRIAAENPLVRAEVYDVQHFPELKERYRVMSVPCLVVNGEGVFFGKKSLPQLLELLGV